ncbi:MAG TPA: Ig-like domain-containing protein, partial [Vicinamibacterales bacterium]
NLYADLPQGAGTKGRWDFVLQSADAAVWVSGVRPKGKDFDLDVTSRIDTGRWLQVTGTVRREGALPWIQATAVASASAPAAPDQVSVSASPIPAAPPPSVIFSMPIANDTDVDRTAAIKIQFSRDMDPASFKNHVRLSYVGPAPTGAPVDPPPYTAQYVEGSRGLEIKCTAPLDRFRTVKVDLLDGITADRDKQPLAAWSMTFTTGG